MILYHTRHIIHKVGFPILSKNSIIILQNLTKATQLIKLMPQFWSTNLQMKNSTKLEALITTLNRYYR